MAEPVWTRQFLRDNGYKDNEIDYDQNSKAVTLQGKAFQYTTPQSDNRAYGTQDELTNALNNYRQGQNQSNVSALTNQMMQYSQAPTQQAYNPTPYQGFNAASNQSYQAALREAARNVQTAGNNAMVQTGSRGVGNSSMTIDRVAQKQQDAFGRVSDTLLPQYEAMDYSRHRDSVGDQFKVNDTNYGRGQDQFRNLMDLSKFTNDLGQQYTDNQRADAGLTGLFQGKQTLQGQQQQFNQGMAQQEQQYRQMRDQISDQQYQQKFDEDVRRYGLDYAAQEAYRNGQMSLSQQGADLSREKFDWEKQQTENKAGNVDKELEGLYTGLTNGGLNASDAIREIDQRLKMGLLTDQDATKLKGFVQKYMESTFTPAADDGVKRQASNNDDLLSMTRDELLKAWETDPTGKSSGRPLYDWRSWILDPNGYRAGTTFELWHNKYGPKMG